MNLQPDTILECEPGLRISLRPSGSFEIEHRGSVLHAGPRGLSVLEVFAKPRSLQAALELLTARTGSRADGLEAVETVFAMINTGCLRRVDGNAASESTPKLSPAVLPFHIALLNDVSRTSSFLAAIKEVVRPGDVVLDVGTGTGVLSVAAARAGARRVYAVEAGGISRQASALFAGSGLGDRISLIQGWSGSVSTPERADVLITETIGDDPLDERILDVVSDARKRLLVEGARVIPSHLTVYAQAVQIPSAELETLTFGSTAVRNWKEAYGIDYEPVRQATDRTLRRCFVKPSSARAWRTVGDPHALIEIDLSGPLAAPERITMDVPAEGSRLDGILLFFEARLSPSHSISTRPSQVSGNNSWSSPLWLLPSEGGLPGQLRFLVEARRNIVLDWQS